MSGIDYIYDLMKRLCIHSITNKPWNLDTLIEKYTGSGIPALTIWEDAVKELGAKTAGDKLARSWAYRRFLCQGEVFFRTGMLECGWKKSITINACLEEASLLGAPLLVPFAGQIRASLWNIQGTRSGLVLKPLCLLQLISV